MEWDFGSRIQHVSPGQPTAVFEPHSPVSAKLKNDRLHDRAICCPNDLVDEDPSEDPGSAQSDCRFPMAECNL